MSYLRSSAPLDGATPADGAEHGPRLSSAAFECIASLAHKEAGLLLVPSKSAMVRTRLARRLRALTLPDFDAYCDFIAQPENRGEIDTMIAALTTNVSHFFRENHHFDFLREHIVPILRATGRAGEKIRIWSAGCSNGQEPYSIAMTLLESRGLATADFKILATDIDPNVLEVAKAGTYGQTMLAGVPKDLLAKYFMAQASEGEPRWAVTPELRQTIVFQRLNLLTPWPMRHKIDVAFCRNVVIYFDQATQDALWTKFARAISPGGWLVLGHSERISPVGERYFEKRGITIYQRTAERID